MINLNKKIDRQGRNLYKVKRYRKRNWLKILVILLVIVAVTYLPARGAYSSAKQLSQSAKELSTAVKNNDYQGMSLAVKKTKDGVDGLNGSLNWFFYLRAIPYFGGYYMDAKHFSLAATYELAAAKTLIDGLEPYIDELGLTGQPTPGQDKVAQAAKMLDKIIPQIDKVEPDLKKARVEVERIEIRKYPELVFGRRLKPQVEAAKNLIIGAHLATSEHRGALEIAPEFLGQPNPKTYLLLFQNDKEMRATGGFMTAYAFLKLDRGHLSTTTSDDIYRLDEKLLRVCLTKTCPLAPPAPIVKYLPEANGKTRTAWSMRDSNLSPDLPTSAFEFERMYTLLGEGLPFDGIIYIDTNVVEGLIKITGPLKVFDAPYSAETDPRCDCPSVIYELEHYAEIASKGEEDRKAILGALMQTLLTQILSSPPDKMLDFVNTGVKLASDKHIMMYLHDRRAQDAALKLNWAGEVKKVQGDYLHINDSNFAGGKSNLYVEERVSLDIDSKTGKHKLAIEYKNPRPFNVWLNGILRDYVRVYLPRGSTLDLNKGSDDPVKMVDDESLDKSFIESFITVRPQNSRKLELEYTVTSVGKTLLIQKQPGAKDHHYIIKVDGRTKAEFNLTTDTEISL